MPTVTFRRLGELGELGNQMFQIAATIGYAKKHNKTAKFPLWTCKISGRDYRHIFNNSINQTLHEKDTVNLYQYQYMDRKYVEIPESAHHNLDLIGYFQSEKYFANCKDDIKHYFSRPNAEIKKYIEEKYRNLIENHSDYVVLHVRTAKREKNDYDVHASATLEFIQTAQDHFKDNNKYIVFADNMIEAKKILPDGKEYIFIEGEENYIDLFLMMYFVIFFQTSY